MKSLMKKMKQIVNDAKWGKMPTRNKYSERVGNTAPHIKPNVISLIDILNKIVIKNATNYLTNGETDELSMLIDRANNYDQQTLRKWHHETQLLANKLNATVELSLKMHGLYKNI